MWRRAQCPGGGRRGAAAIVSRLVAALLAGSAGGPAGAAALEPGPVPGIVGSRFEYQVVRGDSIATISARYAVSERALIRDNRLKPPYRLRPGDTLRVYDRHLVPETLGDGIVINLPQRLLFLFREGRLVAAYAVAAGKPDWRTPTGSYAIADLEQDKAWIVPPSIQAEMRAQGKRVLTRVPPGPDNPLGRYWIGLSLAGYGIHGTNAPTSVYYLRTHGCIRVHPDDIGALYGQVALRMPVKIIYAHTLVARLADGRIAAEVNPDFYHRGGEPLELMREAARRLGVEAAIDWNAAAEIAKARLGQAYEIGRVAAGAAATQSVTVAGSAATSSNEGVGCDGGATVIRTAGRRP